MNLQNYSTEINIPSQDIEITTTKGSGPGGQHRNKVESCVVLKYKPLNLTVRCENERSQHQNKQIAYDILYAKLKDLKYKEQQNKIKEQRNNQNGNGLKVRSYIVKKNIVVDHRNGEKFSLSNWMKGK